MILAAAHSGLCPMSCSLCNIDDSLKQSFGCEQPLEYPIWEYQGDVYYSCPISFIPSEVFEWYMEYDYFINVQGKDIDRLPWTWMLAYGTYRAAVNECERTKQTERSNKSNSMASFRNAQIRGSDG